MASLVNLPFKEEIVTNLTQNISDNIKKGTISEVIFILTLTPGPIKYCIRISQSLL